MRSGSPVVVRQLDEYMVVIDPVREVIELRRALAPGAVPTPDDTLLERYAFAAVRQIELFVGSDAMHRLVLAVGTRTGVDLGSSPTRAQALADGKQLAHLFQVSIDIRSGEFLEAYSRECGPRLSRIQELIDAQLVDPIDPRDELSPGSRSGEAGPPVSARFAHCAPPACSPWAPDELQANDGEAFSMDDLMIEIQSGLSSAYDDGPFAEPRVRTAPEVEAVYPLPTPIDPPPMSAEAEAQVLASHRPPRPPVFERRGFGWLRAALKALTA